MTAYGVALLVVGVGLVLLAVRNWRTRPGWAGYFGKASLLALVGAFVALAGVVDVLIA